MNLSNAFNPSTDGKAERTIQTLDDMLRACVIEFRGNCDDHLPLLEFSYNNRYHSSIGIHHSRHYTLTGVDLQLGRPRLESRLFGVQRSFIWP